MTEYLTEHWLISIFVTIILGAVGSGLWEAAFKPILTKLCNKIFYVVTFNTKRARDNIYKSAAMGHHELPSLYILLVVFMLGISILIGTQIKFYAQVYAPEMSVISIKSDCSHVKAEEIPDCIDKAVKNKVLPLLQILSLIAIFFSVILMHRFISINKTNLVITYFRQCMNSIAPFIDIREIQEIERMFALMTTKEEFVGIIERIQTIASNNDSKLPAPYV